MNNQDATRALLEGQGRKTYELLSGLSETEMRMTVRELLERAAKKISRN